MANKNPNRSGLRRGNPGNIGGGPTPKAWKRFCRRLLGKGGTRSALIAVAKDARNPQHAQIVKMLAAYGYGQPASKLEVGGKLSLETLLAKSWEAEDKDRKSKKRRSRS